MARNLDFAPERSRHTRRPADWSAELCREHLTIALGQLYRANAESVPDDMLALLAKLR